MGVAPFPRDALRRPPQRIYKSDRRSTVWLAAAEGGAWVIKRCELAPLRQRLALLLGLHPAQRECRLNRRLRRDGIDVVPVEDRGTERGRVWLATRAVGESLQALLARGAPGGRAERDRLIEAVVSLWLRLVRAGWFFRDFQAANIVVDGPAPPRLIDVGGTRRSRREAHARRMLRQLYETARAEGLPLTDALRAARLAANRWPPAGSARDLLRGPERRRAPLSSPRRGGSRAPASGGRPPGAPR